MNHDKPKEMEILSNTEKIKTPFYACGNGTDCSNRLNLDDYQGVIFKFLEISEKNPFDDLTNYTYTYKGSRQRIEVKVLKFKDDYVRLGIKNTTILGK